MKTAMMLTIVLATLCSAGSGNALAASQPDAIVATVQKMFAALKAGDHAA